MAAPPTLFTRLGGEDGCRRLAQAFYQRVRYDPALRPLFPGKSLRCATEEFSAFLIQFLGGPESQTQSRWWLSLRESHARFAIGAGQRAAWWKQMAATLDEAGLDDPDRQALREFFREASAYVTGGNGPGSGPDELSLRWAEQRALDDAVSAIAAGDDQEALRLVPRFAGRPSVLTGLLARMARTARPAFVAFVCQTLQANPALTAARFSGRTLLHLASASGSGPVVSCLLTLGADPHAVDRGGHTALYSLANECASQAGPELVRRLLSAGADINAAGGVTAATPLHMAARRGHVEIAAALLDGGARINAVDRQGVTPLRRALNCRQAAVARLLRERGGR